MNPINTPAAVLVDLGGPLQLCQLALPELRSGQVLVEIAYSGVCNSQLLEVRGKRGPDLFLPHTLGHEGSGVVLDVGPDVKKVKAQDRVVVSWIKGSGADVPSVAYDGPKGRVNSGAVSTFMRYTVTCENRLTPIVRDMPLWEAALLGCAIPTGAGIVLNTACVRPGDTVAIFGIGGIGLSAVLASRLKNASLVIAIDIVDEKLEQALALGATHIVNARQKPPLDLIGELTNGIGVDYAIEAAGQSETMEMAFRSVRNGGGLCVLAGNLPAGESISLDPFDLIRGKRIVGTWGGETNMDRDVPLYVDLFMQGKLKLEKMITHSYPLAAINDALKDLERGKVGRALIDMTTDAPEND